MGFPHLAEIFHRAFGERHHPTDGGPDLVADAAFTLIADVAFRRKCRGAGGIFVALTEAAERIKYVRAVVKNKGVIGNIQVAVVIDPCLLNRLLPTGNGRF